MYALITFTLFFMVVWLLIRNRSLEKLRKHVAKEFDETSQILELLNDGVLVCDRDLIIIRMNHIAERMLGLEASKVVGRPIDKMPEDKSYTVVAQVLYPTNAIKEGERTALSHDVLLPSPIDKKYRVFSIPKVTDDKKLTGYIKIMRDVTIETVVEKNKSDIVSIVSHQLMTPLTAIKWLVKSVLDGDAGPLNDKQTDLLKKTRETGEQMIDLVDDILDVTKIEQARFTYKREPYDIIALLKEISSSRMEKASLRTITIKEEYSVANQTMVGDREKLGIAISNLLDNALDYSPAGSVVTVSGKVIEHNFQIRVADKGIGIPKASAANLFTKFYRADNARRVRSKGTGLGLFLAKHIAEDHGGAIRYESMEGEGTTFIVDVPLPVGI